MMQILLFLNTRRKCLRLYLGPTGVAVIVFCMAVLSAAFFYSGVHFSTNRTSEILVSVRQQISSVWQEELSKQGEILGKVRLNAERSLDAMASRLSLLQGHIMRLDALGSRLATMAELDDLDFGVDNPSGMGGPRAAGDQFSNNMPGFLEALNTLELKIQDRSEKLLAMELMLINRTLQGQTLLGGQPAPGGWLSSPYGHRSDPITGKRALHKGMDFAGMPGTPITTVAAGIVTWSGPRYEYGALVEINHGSGYVTRYAHNQKNLVAVGEKVEKGEVIAVMGNSGRSTGTHVHFEVLKHGRHVNPDRYIALQ